MTHGSAPSLISGFVKVPTVAASNRVARPDENSNIADQRTKKRLNKPKFMARDSQSYSRSRVLQTPDEQLEERARRGSPAAFAEFMQGVPDVEPEEYDRLPSDRPPS